jgi:CheY-like chemotaxis protein
MTEEIKKKILIVDDDVVGIAILAKAFEEMGFAILKGHNGQEALTMVKNNKVDLIILDQLMPKMDGIKACALIKADKRFRHIPVIMFTASANESDKKLAQEVGADAYCNKPLNLPVLSRKIKDLLNIV